MAEIFGPYLEIKIVSPTIKTRRIKMAKKRKSSNEFKAKLISTPLDDRVLPSMSDLCIPGVV